jgi:LDH2 family malate/lactate/ureidoglycolate dehydrogenase
MSHQRYAAGALRDWVTAILMRCGVPPGDADRAAGMLVRTSLRGIDTHGVARLRGYVDKLRHGEVNPAAIPSHSRTSGALTIDGDGGLGQIVLPFAIRAAIEAEQAAIACAITRCGHLGALGVLLLDACERGYVAMLCQNTPPIMALPGSRAAAIGNNPIAFAAPVAGREPFVFDIASSVVARGHVAQAQRDGQPIPNGWAIGPDGEPTTDPTVALRGAMRPVAGHKGIGLAMMVECLAGCLGGMANEAPRVHDSAGSASGVSAFLLLVDPQRFVGRDSFDAGMQAWTDHYLGASGTGARYPGQRQAACELERARDGIPLPDSVVAELRATGAELGMAFDDALS